MAQETDAQLQTRRGVIENETAAGANTAVRVGDMFENIIDSKINNDKIIDEDNMASNSVTHVPTQQSVKAYVDASGGGGGHVIEEEGTPLTARSKLNFVGAGVTATDDSGDDASVITIAGILAQYVIDQATPSTASGTVTLDMNSQIQRFHVGSASFSTPKTFAMSNTTNSLSFQFTFTITDIAAVITVPTDWAFQPAAGWSGTTYTFPSTGRWVFGGDWDGTSWNIKVGGPFSV